MCWCEEIPSYNVNYYNYWIYLICSVMVSVLASSTVDRRFEPRLGQIIVYKIGICCFSAKHAALRRTSCWLGIRIMCPNGTTCLSVDCCFSELSLYKSISACWSSINRTSSLSHWKLTCPRHDIGEKLLSWVKQQSLTH